MTKTRATLIGFGEFADAFQHRNQIPLRADWG